MTNEPRDGRRTVDYARLGAVARATELRDIRLASFSAECHDPTPSTADELDLSLAYEADRFQDTDGDARTLYSKIEVKFFAEREGARCATVRGVFVVIYELAEDFDEEVLQQFAEVNGVYNAWSYIRELVSSSLSRFGMPGVLLPVWHPPTELLPRGSKVVLSRRTSRTGTVED